jgi:hypothetical protein
MIPGVWNNSTENYFTDGIARTSGSEVFVIESSGPYDVEYIEHFLGDTWKLIKLMANPLRDEILKMQDGPTTPLICINLNNNILYSIFVISQKL